MTARAMASNCNWIFLVVICMSASHSTASTVDRIFPCISPSSTNPNSSSLANCSISVTNVDGGTGILALAFSAGSNSVNGGNLVSSLQTNGSLQNGVQSSASSINHASGLNSSVQSSVSASGSYGGDLSGTGILTNPAINNVLSQILQDLYSNASHLSGQIATQASSSANGGQLTIPKSNTTRTSSLVRKPVSLSKTPTIKEKKTRQLLTKTLFAKNRSSVHLASKSAEKHEKRRQSKVVSDGRKLKRNQ